MKPENNRIPKTTERRYEDFYDYCFILEGALNACEERENVRHQDADVKVILFVLRALFDKSGKIGLLEEICTIHDIPANVHFDGMEGIPETNPLSKDRTISLKEYLNEKCVTLGGKSFSVIDFIWEYASQDSSHSDKSLTKEIALGEQITLNGMNPNKHQVIAIAKTIYSVNNYILEALNIKYS